ncbi:hypothetical protein, partial [Klebsiella variicola]|uniref:hypothetical protein n=1 Tax=Klebsiella variicola TaxID=244366 RepID=UPI001C45482F
GKTRVFSHPVYLSLKEFSLQDFRGGSLPQNPNRHIMLTSGIRLWQPEFPTKILSWKTGAVHYLRLNQLEASPQEEPRGTTSLSKRVLNRAFIV